MTDKMQMLYFDSILVDVKTNTIKQAFQLLSDHISALIGTPSKIIFDHLMAQEREESTSIGNGISLPHMKLPRLTKPMIIFAKTNHALDIDTVDNLPVDQICLVLSPDYEGVKHLQRLANVSRHFKNNRLCSDLREAKTQSQVRQIINDVNEKKLAA